MHTDENSSVDHDLVDQIGLVMRYLAPEVPHSVAMGRLEQAASNVDGFTLYQMGYFIVTGKIQP